VIDVTAKQAVYMDRFNQIDYTFQVQRLNALAEKFRPYAVIAEQNSVGIPVIEQLIELGLPVSPFNTTNATKKAAIEGLSLAFERGRIQIVNDPVATSELQAYEAERLPSGLFRYNAPEGMHDDTVMALAIGWTAAREDDWIIESG
jgi:hypothetical protein